MFVENYRLEEPPLGGGAAHINETIPYPRISDREWSHYMSGPAAKRGLL